MLDGGGEELSARACVQPVREARQRLRAKTRAETGHARERRRVLMRTRSPWDLGVVPRATEIRTIDVRVLETPLYGPHSIDFHHGSSQAPRHESPSVETRREFSTDGAARGLFRVLVGVARAVAVRIARRPGEPCETTAFRDESARAESLSSFLKRREIRGGKKLSSATPTRVWRRAVEPARACAKEGENLIFSEIKTRAARA